MASTDAVNRIFRFHMSSMSPAVITLPVHLKGQNVAAFNDRGSNASLLIRWLIMRPLELENVSYEEYYQDYVIATNDRNEGWMELPFRNVPVRCICRRTRGVKVAHIRHILPSRGEVYYLRAILRDGKTARRWSGLRTVDGRVYETYQAAAIASGMFNDVREAQATMQEAVELMRTPSQLRFLYVQLIIDGTAPALPLFEQFRDRLSADHRFMNDNEPRAIRNTLNDVGRLLQNHQRTLQDFGFPAEELQALRIQEELDYWLPATARLQQYVAEAMPQLNENQQEWLTETTQAIHQCLNGGPSMLRLLEGKGIHNLYGPRLKDY